MALEDKVALITGAAGGQGRNHALRLAEEGAEIIALDGCVQVEGVSHEMPSRDDLEQTGAIVRECGRRCICVQADVRDQEALEEGVAAAARSLGGLDVVVANAAILTFGRLEAMAESTWQTMIDINLSGSWRTVKAAVPWIRDGGSVIFISSVLGLKGSPEVGHYVVAKHGLVGLMRTFAHELADRRIRVNSVHPTEVNTKMLLNETIYRLYRPDLPEPGVDDFVEAARQTKLLPTPWVEPDDVSAAVVFLASDASRYVTGVTLPVDAGAFAR